MVACYGKRRTANPWYGLSSSRRGSGYRICTNVHARRRYGRVEASIPWNGPSKHCGPWAICVLSPAAKCGGQPARRFAKAILRLVVLVIAVGARDRIIWEGKSYFLTRFEEQRRTIQKTLWDRQGLEHEFNRGREFFFKERHQLCGCIIGRKAIAQQKRDVLCRDVYLAWVHALYGRNFNHRVFWLVHLEQKQLL